MLSRLKTALRALARRTQVERELDEELRYHIERQTEQNIRLGMNPAEVRQAALKSFGGVGQAKEWSRDARGVRWLENLVNKPHKPDSLRYDFRFFLEDNMFKNLRSLLMAAAVLIGSAAVASAQGSPQDYPQWRGRNRDGAASGFTEPKAWPEKLTRRWKVEVGEGYATPIVVGKTVYAFTRRDGAETMTALDAATGKLIWRTDYPAPYKAADAAAAHGAGPKATPLFHNGKLFTVGISGVVSAFNAATGKLLWQKPAPAEHPYFGMAASPLGDKDLVILHPGSYGPLTAYDANTGEVRWAANGDGVYASPIIVELGGVRQIVSMTNKSVISVAVADGAPLWEHPWKPAGTDSAITPIVYGETIIVAGQRMPVTALKPTRRDGKWVVEVVWENMDVSLFMSNPALIGDTLFGLSEKSSGQFFGLDAKTGKTLWLGQPREASNTAVVKAGDLLFMLNDDAELIVARGSQTGFEPVKRYTVADSATWAQPAISGNRVFVKDVTSLTLWTLK